jgi:hypothetical protein
MTEPTKIPITTTNLIEATPYLTEDQAKKVIADAKSAVVEDKPAEIENQTPTSITIKTPDGLGGGPWLIVLITQEGKFAAVLSYEPNTKKFFIPHDEKVRDDIPHDEEVRDDGDIIIAINKAAETIEKAGQAIANALATLRDDRGHGRK